MRFLIRGISRSHLFADRHKKRSIFEPFGPTSFSTYLIMHRILLFHEALDLTRRLTISSNGVERGFVWEFQHFAEDRHGMDYGTTWVVLPITEREKLGLHTGEDALLISPVGYLVFYWRRLVGMHHSQSAFFHFWFPFFFYRWLQEYHTQTAIWSIEFVMTETTPITNFYHTFYYFVFDS